jgi:hypothetical protein
VTVKRVFVLLNYRHVLLCGDHLQYISLATFMCIAPVYSCLTLPVVWC